MRTKFIVALLFINLNLCTYVRASDSGQSAYSYGALTLVSACAGMGVGVGAYFSHLAYKGWKRWDVNKKLYNAALSNDAIAAQSAIDEGADITVYQDGSTPLMWAAYRGSKNVAQVIIKKASDLSGEKQIDPSCYLDQKAIANWNRNWTFHGQPWYPTALHIAANTGCIETVKALIEAKADYTIVDNFGISALKLAALNNGNSVVGHLLTLSKTNVPQEVIDMQHLYKNKPGLAQTVQSVLSDRNRSKFPSTV